MVWSSCKKGKGIDGESIGWSHANPLFDTHEYEVEFTDGSHDKYQADIIAKNMFAQVDDEGHQFLLLDEIADHCKDNTAVHILAGTVQNAKGHNLRVGTLVAVQGWVIGMGKSEGLEGIKSC